MCVDLNIRVHIIQKPKIEANKRLLKVSKNRLFGRVCPTGWVMSYDEKSRRIYGQGDDPMRDTGQTMLNGEQIRHGRLWTNSEWRIYELPEGCFILDGTPYEIDQ